MNTPLTPLVLVVDFNQAAQNRAAETLRSAGYRVRSAATPEDALPGEKPQLAVIADHDQSTESLCRQLRQQDANLPLLRLVERPAQTTTPFIEAALESDLPYSADPQVLLATVRLMLAASALHRQMRQSRQLLQCLSETCPDCVMVLDLQGNILSINPAGQQLLEIADLTPLLNTPWPNLWQGGQRTIASVALAAARSGSSRSFQAACPTASGAEKWWDVWVGPIPGEDQLQGLLVLARDITELHRLRQHSRQQQQALDNLSGGQNSFLSLLSHDLRTPLTPVMMSASALFSDDTLPRRVRDEAAIIHRNAEEARRLLEELLDVAQAMAGRLQLKLCVLDMHAELRTAIGTLAEELRQRQLNVVTQLRADKPYVSADPRRLQQILTNLLRDAMSIATVGGRITVRTWNHTVTRGAEDNAPPAASALQEMLTLEIAPELPAGRSAPQRLFSTAEETPLPKQYAGLELGMALCRSLLALHQASFRQQRSTTGPATLAVDFAAVHAPAPSLLRAHQPPPPLIAPAEQSRDLSSVRVLLVDDHPDTAKVLSRLLHQGGYGVSTAHSVAEALAVADRNHGAFDVVISDLGLPDGSGLELMRQLRLRYKLKGIAFSGFGMQEDARLCSAAGFAGQLQKPIDLKTLQDTITRVLKA